MKPYIRSQASAASGEESQGLKIEIPALGSEPSYSVEDGRLVLYLPMHLMTDSAQDVLTEIAVSLSHAEIAEMAAALGLNISDIGSIS